MPPLDGRVVALLESRMADELAGMVRRHGGEPLSAPAVREVPCLAEAAAGVRALAAGEYDAAVFLSGAGVSALLRQADQAGLLERSVAALGRMTLAARGPKPLGVLKRHGLTVAISTVRPHTFSELLAAFEAARLARPRTLLVHYGERNHDIAAALTAAGALVSEVCPYEWALPEDPQPLAALVGAVLNDAVDAMLFTSQIQARHLFAIAREMRLAPELAASMNRGVVVGAVGPVCARALKDFGVQTDVLPEAPNMAALIGAVAEYFSLRADGDETNW